MPKISQDCLAQVLSAFERYKEEVNAAPIADNTKNTYISHTDQFVRWLNDGFEPGDKNRRR